MKHTLDVTRKAEWMLLGTLFHKPEEIHRIVDTLHPDHFATKDTQDGYAMARDLAAEGKLDMISFSKSFSDGMWTSERIAEVSDAYTNSGYVPIERLADEIRDGAIRRKAREIGRKIQVEESVEAIQELYAEMGNALDITHKKPFYLTWKNPEEFVNALYSPSVRENLTKTGFPSLDDLIAGLCSGELLVFGAASSTGKTTFALDIAWNIARTKPVAFISVEMEDESLKRKFYSTISVVEPDKIRPGTLTPVDKEAFSRVVAEVKKRHLILDFHSFELNDMILRIRRLVSEHKVSVVLIDYCQQILSEGKKGESREREVARIPEMLKRVAVQTGCAIILLSQINRKGEESEEPEMWHLRESGALGQAADYVLLAWRKIGKEEVTHFKLAKNRTMTRLGYFNIVFDKKRMTYRPLRPLSASLGEVSTPKV